MRILAKIFVSAGIILFILFFAFPIADEVSWSITKSLWADRSKVDAAAAGAGTIVGMVLYSLMLLVCLWLIIKVWSGKKVPDTAEATNLEASFNATGPARKQQQWMQQQTIAKEELQERERSQQAHLDEERRQADARKKAEDENVNLADYANAKVAIKYRQEAADAWAQTSDLPVDLRRQFLTALDMDPRQDLPKLLSLVEGEHKKRVRPFTDKAANDAVEQARTISAEAAAEFIKVYDTFGGDLAAAKILEKIEREFGPSERTIIANQNRIKREKERERELHKVAYDAEQARRESRKRDQERREEQEREHERRKQVRREGQKRRQEIRLEQDELEQRDEAQREQQQPEIRRDKSKKLISKIGLGPLTTYMIFLFTVMLAVAALA